MIQILQLLVIISLIVSPILNHMLNSLFYREEIILWSSIITSILLSIWCINLFFNKKANNHKLRISFCHTDAILLLYLLIGLINIAVVRSWQIETIIIIKWIALLLVYILFRLLPNKKIILIGLMLSGFVQSAITLLQSMWLFESNHTMFNATGTFGNPGQLGGWLAVSIIVTIGLLSNTIQNKQRRISTLILLILIPQAIAFHIADSRASFVGLVIGLIFIFSNLTQRLKAHKTILFTVFFTLITIGCTLLYQYRPQSAKARLLIWSVSCTMFKERPIFGHGVASFDQKYMLYQAQYFKTNTDSQFVEVADNVAYPYNELLHIAVELGIIGVLIVTLLFITIFTHKSKTYTQKIIKGALVSIIIYSMFSYPSYIFPLLLLFPIFAGGVYSNTIVQIKIKKKNLLLILFILIGTINTGVLQLRFYKNVSFHTKILSKQCHNRDNSKEFINDNFRKLKYNTRFMNLYFIWLPKSLTCNNDINKLRNIVPSCEGYCDIGNVYLNNGYYKRAEEYFNTASYMIPTRLKPNYCLWQLYCKCNDPENAVRVAKKILVQPLKIENTFTLRAKGEVKEYLENVLKD